MILSGRMVAAAMCVVTASLLYGCASSSLAEIWHEPSYRAPPLDRVLVIAIRKDATKRRIWEDAFAGELEKYSVTATPSYSLFTDAPPDTDQVLAAVQENGFDGILVILTLPAETTTQNIQGYTTTEQSVRYSPYSGPYWQRYRTYYREIEYPGYTDSQTVDLRTIDVTATGNGGRLIWSATSRTPDPGSVTDVQRGIVSLVMSSLTKQNIIPQKE